MTSVIANGRDGVLRLQTLDLESSDEDVRAKLLRVPTGKIPLLHQHQHIELTSMSLIKELETFVVDPLFGS